MIEARRMRERTYASCGIPGGDGLVIAVRIKKWNEEVIRKGCRRSPLSHTLRSSQDMAPLHAPGFTQFRLALVFVSIGKYSPRHR